MTPTHAAGAVNVVVTDSDGQSCTLPNGYTYIAPADFTIAASALSPANRYGWGIGYFHHYHPSPERFLRHVELVL